MTDRPNSFNGLRHLALVVPNLEECVAFYTDVLGMAVLRKASDDLIYLTCGNDNLSLGRQHGDDAGQTAEKGGHMDHFGFIVDSVDDLHAWYDYLKEKGVTVLDAPMDHGDGARSFHCTDPAGNVIQPLYHPAVSGQRFDRPSD